jgi:hypothetical protein
MNERHIVGTERGCLHSYPDVIRFRDEKRDNRYYRVAECCHCGMTEEELNPREFSRKLIDLLDEWLVISNHTEGEDLSELRERERARMRENQPMIDRRVREMQENEDNE